MKNRVLVLGFLLSFGSHGVAYGAPTLDWSTVTLSGAFPNYSFVDPTLGAVSLSYSADSEFSALSTFFPDDTVILGNTGGETLTMSWANPATSFDMDIWDIDAVANTQGESVSLVTLATITPVSVHATDIWTSGTSTLSSDLTVNPNDLAGNFSVLNFANAAGFNSITFNWAVDSSTGVLGIGKLSEINTLASRVPEPNTLGMLLAGLAGLVLWRRRVL